MLTLSLRRSKDISMAIYSTHNSYNFHLACKANQPCPSCIVLRTSVTCNIYENLRLHTHNANCSNRFFSTQNISTFIVLSSMHNLHDGNKQNRSLCKPLSLQNLLVSVLLDGLQNHYQLLQCSLFGHPTKQTREEKGP